MVVVKVELWPNGDETKARTIGRIKIANDGTGTLERGNYNVELSHSGRYSNKPGVWKKGKVVGYRRLAQSPYHLVKMALTAAGIR
jgi:hypothetical protein